MDDNLQADFDLAAAEVEKSLLSARVSERAAIEARAAIERIQRLVKRQLQKSPIEPTDPLIKTTKTSAHGVRPKEAAEMLGVHLTTVWRLMQRGKLESYHVGKARLVRTSSIRKMQEGGG